ncbi:hypothetical protein Y032_0413g1009 [Ancylostoma ceylanicum]|uniref:Uncharacterized protein n=1 Tax=Ancylostoma ceylanicum TaxID=53326 RepID=A0A016X3U0_9BILA|nr:hypothetical protein Y032_0413g1009 [Ancylostoma ceylanicum]
MTLVEGCVGEEVHGTGPCSGRSSPSSRYPSCAVFGRPPAKTDLSSALYFVDHLGDSMYCVQLPVFAQFLKG